MLEQVVLYISMLNKARPDKYALHLEENKEIPKVFKNL